MSLVADLAQIATAAGVTVTAVLGYRNGRQLGVVHKAVNSTAQEQNARTDQLTASLTQAGVDVPARPASGDTSV